MNNKLKHYPVLAELFRYPDATFPGRVQAAQRLLEELYPEAAAELKPFTEFASTADQATLEELYTRSFDVQAVTTLDLGYVLFGDDYKRGAVLVHLNEEHRLVGNPCGHELADHLPNVLRLLPLMTDEALRDELVARIVGPALRKVIREFEPDQAAKKRNVYEKHHKTWIDRSEDYGGIYRQPVAALFMVLAADFEIEEPAQPKPTSDFLRNIGTEIVLEAQ